MIQPQIYAQALHAAITEVSAKDHDKVLENFVRILNQNGDLGLYDQIEAEYEKIEASARGIKEVQLTTAQNVDSAAIIEQLNKVVGSKAEIKHQIDERLIGGVVVRVDDTLIDASMKAQLQELRKNIAQ